MGKGTFDSLIGEAGNYTAQFAEMLQAGLNSEAAGRVDFQVRPDGPVQSNAPRPPRTGWERHSSTTANPAPAASCWKSRACAMLLSPTESHGYSTIGGSLGTGQREVEVQWEGS